MFLESTKLPLTATLTSMVGLIGWTGRLNFLPRTMDGEIEDAL